MHGYGVRKVFSVFHGVISKCFVKFHAVIVIGVNGDGGIDMLTMCFEHLPRQS